MTSAAASVARLSSPAELAAAVPYLCGYVPDEALVVLALRGPRGRLGLTQACPLPPPDVAVVVAGQALQRVRAVGAQAACALLYTRDPGPRAHPDLVLAVQQAARRWSVDLRDLLLVRDARCWSALCDDPVCCPPEGRPVPSASAGLSLLQAQSAAQGRAVLASRAALADSLAPCGLPAEASAR
ncbi:MAG: DUF4192 domain-containing protein, partial [Actinomycetota bacterium]|nr:DUF4192 domain-containing protein [Actinomycetota bacterium]